MFGRAGNRVELEQVAGLAGQSETTDKAPLVLYEIHRCVERMCSVATITAGDFDSSAVELAEKSCRMSDQGSAHAGATMFFINDE